LPLSPLFSVLTPTQEAIVPSAISLALCTFIRENLVFTSSVVFSAIFSDVPEVGFLNRSLFFYRCLPVLLLLFPTVRCRLTCLSFEPLSQIKYRADSPFQNPPLQNASFPTEPRVFAFSKPFTGHHRCVAPYSCRNA